MKLRTYLIAFSLGILALTSAPTLLSPNVAHAQDSGMTEEELEIEIASSIADLHEVLDEAIVIAERIKSRLNQFLDLEIPDWLRELVRRAKLHMNGVIHGLNNAKQQIDGAAVKAGEGDYEGALEDLGSIADGVGVASQIIGGFGSIFQTIGNWFFATPALPTTVAVTAIPQPGFDGAKSLFYLSASRFVTRVEKLEAANAWQMNFDGDFLKSKSAEICSHPQLGKSCNF